MTDEKGRVSRWVLLRVWLRLFLLQASWNFERLQSLGALYVLAPALRILYREEDLAEAYRRHLEYFNTHPFMASPVLGAAIALEEERCRGAEGALGVEEFKGMIMAPYAAMGDGFFWGGLRPLAAAVALFFAAKGSLWAPLVFLTLFNVPHLWIRTFGLWRGYTLGLKVVETLHRHRLPDLAIRLKEGTLVLLGGLCAYLTYRALQGEGESSIWGLSVIPLVALLGWLARRGVSTLMLTMTLAALVLAFLQFG
ncbi:phosphotransferase system IID component, Man family [Desulfuromonas soudanensis]|uniref:Phosphotransferase system IID component, Man family n=1 Tax=Desulfuromonas soudanensis TaxID=1603606 RepID=A0A0M4CZT0_9BACT|nr:phosphotransferase system IID component, Man family [Desulfuromonas soudanensis]